MLYIELSSVVIRFRQYHSASVIAFLAYKQLYTDQVMPLLADQTAVEAALLEAEPRAALDAEVMHCTVNMIICMALLTVRDAGIKPSCMHSCTGCIVQWCSMSHASAFPEICPRNSACVH